ncbi:helix-turn-helix transcriptional regulator [Terriglobus albidus]|uniref:Helix-turn-helix transcriptional regulator n=1 Tax=Terriglobus albidus TaxID=1592106 RepID=A0A5B9ED52_9BACT|nr:PadR family transcriptional regulator [Terriglobus albidus]QEE28016.1 helix-turn-helix transcriptional regulator [Terriglobus albidus]
MLAPTGLIPYQRWPILRSLHDYRRPYYIRFLLSTHCLPQSDSDIVGIRQEASLEKAPPLSPATLHILLALAAGDLHGYGIIQEIARHSEGHYRPGPGTLYDNLKKLMDLGLVADVLKPSSQSDEERRFYTLTSDGWAALSAEIDRLQQIVRKARSRLQHIRPGNV